MSQFWSELVHTLTPYVPGEQPKIDNLIKLNTNENPYPPSPKVLAAIAEQNNEKLRLYPDPNSDLLKQSIADYHNLSTDQVFVGNGSDEVLAHAFQGLLKQDAPLLFPDITYSFYPVYCGLYGIEYQNIPLNDDFEIVPEDYQRECGAIIFPNPNAPTGRLLGLDAIKQLLEMQPNRLVLVDEAYIDFGGESAISLVKDYPNLLVTQTLSKSRSLAGIRVGFAVGQAHLIEALERVKNSFNSYPVDRLALFGASASFEDETYFQNCCQKIISTRETLTNEMTQMGFDVVPSAANFIFAKHQSKDAEALAQALRERKIIVRYFNKPRINQHLRITIGTDEENNALVSALKEILSA